VLLFKVDKARVELLRRAAQQRVERVLVDRARPLVLLHELLKLGKAQEELLLFVSLGWWWWWWW
jgi:hypothetical protein